MFTCLIVSVKSVKFLTRNEYHRQHFDAQNIYVFTVITTRDKAAQFVYYLCVITL